MSQYDELKNLIQRTISSVYVIKSFMEKVYMLLGQENDTAAITEVKKKVEIAEQDIQDNLAALSKIMNKKRTCNTAKRINNYQADRLNVKKKKLVNDFEANFKGYLYFYNFKARQKTLQIDIRTILENIKKNYKKILTSVESFEYSREDKKFKIQIKFLFGIEIVIFSENGRVDSYSLLIHSQSIILNQLLSLFEIMWEFELGMADRSFQAAIQKVSRWLDQRKHFYTEKCRICDMHLSFKSGSPMLPLAVLHNIYYHIDCFYDYQA